MKRYVCLTVLGLAVFANAAFAMSCCADTDHEGHAKALQEESAAVDVGNKICPVSDEPIDEAAKVTYEYEGKIYNFCCAMCVDEFKKEPQKYIDKVNQELEDSQSAK